jgi:hypothetical protein
MKRSIAGGYTHRQDSELLGFIAEPSLLQICNIGANGFISESTRPQGWPYRAPRRA